MQDFLTIDPTGLTDQAVLAGRDQALVQMLWMRQYTLQLIESVPLDLWYTIPSGASTHLSWQVGHLAVAQYGLMLFRQRGRVELDMELMPGWLRKNFGRGSQPNPDPDDSKKPTAASLLEHLQAIHSQASLEVPDLPLHTLKETTEMPYAAYPIKLGALMFCPLHESIHAGQIGLLRRLLGLAPIR